MDARNDDHPPGRLREELRADRRGQVHLPRRRPRPQDPDRPRGRGDLRGQGRRGPHLQGAGRSRSAAACTRARRAAGRRPSSSSPPANGSSCSRAQRPHRDIGMPNRKTKPTSPGRRFATYPLREQLTESSPERKLTEGLRKSGGRNANGRVTARHRGGGAKRRYRQIDFKRLKDGVPAKVASDRVRPQPQLLHRPAALRRRRQELHPRPGRDLGRRRGPVRPRRRHPARQRARARRDADRHARPQRRAHARPGRQARPLGRHLDPARRQGGRRW